jgi:hypothetical protein
MKEHDPFPSEPIHISLIVTAFFFCSSAACLIVQFTLLNDLPIQSIVVLTRAGIVFDVLALLSFRSYMRVTTARIEELKRR